MPDALSDDSAHKLKAALINDWADPDQRSSTWYIAECMQWFASLSGPDRLAAAAAGVAFYKGDKAGALKLAATLPAAPKCPLI